MKTELLGTLCYRAHLVITTKKVESVAKIHSTKVKDRLSDRCRNKKKDAYNRKLPSYFRSRE